MEIKNLELTERDFQLLVEALDCLPERGAVGDLMGDLIVGMMRKGDESDMADFDKKRQIEKIKKAQEKEAIKEEIKILQGKLLMFKRFLIQQNALKQVDDILNFQL